MKIIEAVDVRYSPECCCVIKKNGRILKTVLFCEALAPQHLLHHHDGGTIGNSS